MKSFKGSEMGLWCSLTLEAKKLLDCASEACRIKRYIPAGGNWFLESDKGEKEKLAIIAWSYDQLKFESLNRTFELTGGSEAIFPDLAQMLRGCDTASSSS